ncbi:uncharacterized protein LOC141713475 [Apium graveolens]|uniref:uncharacterized protein LOC141713475 n=1 Tax=Apium graveolens TaxID=4045 RepID=UPI003D7A0D49
MKTNRNYNPADDISRKKQKLKNAESVNKEAASRKDLARYFEDVKKSECFEVGYYPNLDPVYSYTLMVRKIYDSSDTDENNLEDDFLLYLSKLAICFFNIREDTYFGNVKVVMATNSGVKNENHYITFQAFLSTRTRRRIAVTFQTHIVVQFVSSHPIPGFEIMFVRIKPSDAHQNNSNNSQQGQPCEIVQQRLSQVIETYTIDSELESRYSLALYLSQYALHDYNLSKLSLSVAKHDIDSLKVVELMKPVAEVPTYRITFQAPLRAKTKMKNVETFMAEICLPSLFPTTNIKFKKFQKRR